MQKLAILVLLACAACTTRADGPSSTPAAPRAGASGAAPAIGAPAGTLARIQALVGKAECSDDSQCKVLPIGAKACGGPASYLAWSTATPGSAELPALAERYRAEQQASNTSSGRISTCSIVPEPQVACRANTCQLAGATLAR